MDTLVPKWYVCFQRIKPPAVNRSQKPNVPHLLSLLGPFSMFPAWHVGTGGALRPSR